MEKELDLTEAVHVFAQKPSAKKADRLHSLIAEGTFYVPVKVRDLADAKRVMEEIEQGGEIPIATFNSPNFQTYLPVFTSEEQYESSKLQKENTIFIGLDVTGLNDLLITTGTLIQTIVFDPEYSGLAFLKDRFLTYTKELLKEEEKERQEKAAHTPYGEVVEIKDINKLCDKKLLKDLKRTVSRDKRIKNVWVYQQAYENKAVSYTIVVEAECDDPGVLRAIEKACSPFISKRAPLISCYYQQAPDEVREIVEEINPAALNFSWN